MQIASSPATNSQLIELKKYRRTVDSFWKQPVNDAVQNLIWETFRLQSERKILRQIYFFQCGKDKHCYASVAKLANETGFSRVTVMKVISSLALRNYVYKEPRAKGSRLTNKIVFNVKFTEAKKSEKKTFFLSNNTSLLEAKNLPEVDLRLTRALPEVDTNPINPINPLNPINISPLYPPRGTGGCSNVLEEEVRSLIKLHRPSAGPAYVTGLLADYLRSFGTFASGVPEDCVVAAIRELAVGDNMPTPKEIVVVARRRKKTAQIKQVEVIDKADQGQISDFFSKFKK